MKKILAFVLCFVLLLLCACGNTNEKNYEIKMFNDLLGTQPYIKQLTKLSELSNTYSSRYKDETVPASRTVEILGNTYTAPYYESRWSLGINTHYYLTTPTKENPSPELCILWFDAQSEELLSYAIPYTVNAVTENEYLEIIRTQILSEYDLSAYHYTCTTAYDKVYDSGKSYHKPFFYVCDENETVDSYYFEFINMIGGYETNDKLSVQFLSSGSISVVTRKLGYTEKDFEKLLSKYDAIEEEIYSQYLNPENASELYEITKVGELSDHILYLDNGVPHLRMRVTVWFKELSDNDEHTTVMELLVKHTG